MKENLRKSRSAPTRRAGMRLMVWKELEKNTLADCSRFSCTPGVFHKSIREAAAAREGMNYFHGWWR